MNYPNDDGFIAEKNPDYFKFLSQKNEIAVWEPNNKNPETVAI